jgi:hypothetical protein
MSPVALSKETRMYRQTDIAILRRYSAIAWSTSLLVVAFGVVSLLLFVRPSAIGVQTSPAGTYQGNPIWLIFGGLLVVFGIAFQVVAYRWPRHLLRVLSTETPKSMRLQVEVEDASDSTQYYALLSDDSAPSKRKGWRVGLWAPSSATRELVGRELTAKVYLDCRTGHPAVIEHVDGYLWAMKGPVTPLRESALPGA